MSHITPKPPVPPAGTTAEVIAYGNDLVAWVRGVLNTPSHMPSYTVAEVALLDANDFYSSAARNPHSAMIYVTDESGGAVPAFSDGTNFRRVTDRAIVS